MGQIGLADIEYSNRKRKTKREEFLEVMESVIVWEEWTGLILPYYPNGKRGRPTRGAEQMLRMYLLQNWFNLSDEGVEDAIYDSYAFRNFMKVDFTEKEHFLMFGFTSNFSNSVSVYVSFMGLLAFIRYILNFGV